MTLTLKHPAQACTEQEWRDDAEPSVTIPAGAVVVYRSHLPGGMVKVVHDGRPLVIHPGATAELS